MIAVADNTDDAILAVAADALGPRLMSCLDVRVHQAKAYVILPDDDDDTMLLDEETLDRVKYTSLELQAIATELRKDQAAQTPPFGPSGAWPARAKLLARTAELFCRSKLAESPPVENAAWWHDAIAALLEDVHSPAPLHHFVARALVLGELKPPETKLVFTVKQEHVEALTGEGSKLARETGGCEPIVRDELRYNLAVRMAEWSTELTITHWTMAELRRGLYFMAPYLWHEVHV